MLLALLQRLTGVVHEEQIMAKLLTLHPKYVQSIKRMPGITGSTADEFVKGSVMDHLKRGLAATGLLDELEHRNEGHSFGLASASFAKRSSSFMRRRMSVCRGATGSAAQAEAQQQAEDAREKRQRELRRGALSRCATTNNMCAQFGVISAFGGTSASFNAGNGSFKNNSFNSTVSQSPGNSFSRANSRPSNAMASVLNMAGSYDDHLTA